MEKDFSINEEGYSVRCRLFHQGHARTFKRVVICTHGFGSNKDKPNITRFAEKETGGVVPVADLFEFLQPFRVCLELLWIFKILINCITVRFNNRCQIVFRLDSALNFEAVKS